MKYQFLPNFLIFIDNYWSHSQLKCPLSYEESFDNRFSFELVNLMIIICGPQSDTNDLEKLQQMCAYTEFCASETLKLISKQEKLLIDEELIKLLEIFYIISRSKISWLQSLIENKESRFGNFIAYIKLAEDIVNKFIAGTKNNYSYLIVKDKEHYQKLLEENKRIYKFIIPKSVEYPLVKKLQVVKPAVLTYENLFYGKKCQLAEVFKKLVPIVFFS
ncbi:hypothetical protein MXB_2795 [Myxobolus squamalis]|nr:hypothetical protein MXB_2795 [Myxobolus squamalis]